MEFYNNGITFDDRYGNIKKFGRLRQKRQFMLEEMTFLKICVNKKIIPRSLRIRKKGRTEKDIKIIAMAEMKILKNKLKEKRRDLSKLELKLYHMHIYLANHFDKTTWQDIDNKTLTYALRLKRLKKNRLIQKIQRLTNEQISNQLLYKRNVDKKFQKQWIDAVEKRNGILFKSRTVAESNNYICMRNNMLNTDRSTPQLVVNGNFAQRVRNLSSIELTHDQLNFLGMGPKFAINTKVDEKNIICAVEAGLQGVNHLDSHIIRSGTAELLRDNYENRKKEKKTDRKKYWQIVRSIKKEKHITITRADKGNTVVVMDTADYNKKIEDELRGGKHTEINKDPIQIWNKNTKEVIKELEVLGLLTAKQIVVRCPKTPKLYATVKLHKEGNPLRTIVAGYSSPMMKLESWLGTLLKKYIRGNHVVKNTLELINKLKTTQLSGEDVLVSFDVEKMFPSIPKEGVLQIIKEHLDCDEELEENKKTKILFAINFVWSNMYFTFNDKYFQQNEGAPIGSSLSPFLAEIYMERFEETIKKKISIFPERYFRYVDDILIIWNNVNNDLNDLLRNFNEQNRHLKFTMEIEKERSINFLDVNISRNEDERSLEYKVYRKPTYSGINIHKLSQHHPSQKNVIISTLVNRALKYSSTKEFLREELEQIVAVGVRNGYTQEEMRHKIFNSLKKNETKITPKLDKLKTSQIEKKRWITLPYYKGITDKIGKMFRRLGYGIAYKPLNTIASVVFNNKGKVKEEEKMGIYNIECECGSRYIGITERSLGKRKKEHMSAEKNGDVDKSAVARHVWEDCDKKIKWEDMKIIANETDTKKRYILESLLIYQSKITGKIMNKQEDTYFLDSVWKAYLQQMNNW